MVLLHVDAVLTGVDSVDMIQKIFDFTEMASMTHVSCVDPTDAADKERHVLQQGMSWR